MQRTRQARWFVRRILYLTCSPRGHDAHSRRAADSLIAALRRRHERLDVRHRDLFTDPPPLIDAGFSAAILSADDAAPALAASEVLIQELEAADALVIATQMHNFAAPAVLKAWIDQVVRIHRSFRSTPQGKVGLLADRPVFVVVAAGGWFTGPSPAGAPAQPDFLTPYLRAILGTIGLRDIRFVLLEGVARGEQAIERAFRLAGEQIRMVLDRV